jgi:hypothetical protein
MLRERAQRSPDRRCASSASTTVTGRSASPRGVRRHVLRLPRDVYARASRRGLGQSRGEMVENGDLGRCGGCTPRTCTGSTASSLDDPDTRCSRTPEKRERECVPRARGVPGRARSARAGGSGALTSRWNASALSRGRIVGAARVDPHRFHTYDLRASGFGAHDRPRRASEPRPRGSVSTSKGRSTLSSSFAEYAAHIAYVFTSYRRSRSKTGRATVVPDRNE